MQSSYDKHNRHHRSGRRDDEDLLVPRAAAVGSKVYDRGQTYRPDSYRAASTSSRDHYGDIASSSARHQDSGWRSDSSRVAHDRYSYPEDDAYGRSSRDLYDPVTSVRTHDAWDRRVSDSHHAPLPDAEWSAKHHDTYTPTASYSVRGSWDAANAYEKSHAGYNDWPVDDIRHRHPNNGRSQNRAEIDDRQIPPDIVSVSNWRRDDRQDRNIKIPSTASNQLKKTPSQKNWQGQGRDVGGGKKGKRTPSSWVAPDMMRVKGANETALSNSKDEGRPTGNDDRSWEPAPTWKPSDGGQRPSTSSQDYDQYSDFRGRSDRNTKKSGKTDKRKGVYESNRLPPENGKNMLVLSILICRYALILVI